MSVTPPGSRMTRGALLGSPLASPRTPRVRALRGGRLNLVQGDRLLRGGGSDVGPQDENEGSPWVMKSVTVSSLRREWPPEPISSSLVVVARSEPTSSPRSTRLCRSCFRFSLRRHVFFSTSFLSRLASAARRFLRRLPSAEDCSSRTIARDEWRPPGAMHDCQGRVVNKLILAER